VAIEADRQVLARVLGNLLQHAFKFTRPRTTVTLRVGASAERVVIEIQDECGGLRGGSVNELFRPFEQRSVDRIGLGLGLAFSRWGVEANDGRIYARNLPEAPTLKPADVLDWTGVRTERVQYEPAAMIFAQGDPATSVMYVENGAVQLSVLSHAGKEAVAARCRPVAADGHCDGNGRVHDPGR
jgi:signal transduction histidine kinase